MKALRVVLVLYLASQLGEPLLKCGVSGAAKKPSAPVLREFQDLQLGVPILSLDLADGSDMVAAALADGHVRVWHLDTGEVIQEFTFGNPQLASRYGYETNELLRARFAPDGNTLAISYRNRIYQYEIETWRQVRNFGLETEDPPPAHKGAPSGWQGEGLMTVTDFAFTHDGNRIVAGYCRAGCNASITFDGELNASPTDREPIRLWDVQAEKLEWDQAAAPGEAAERVVPSPNGKLFATVSQMFPGPNRAIRLYDLATGQQLYALPKFDSNQLAPDVLFTRDSRQFVTASRTPWREGEKSHRAYCMRMHLGLFETQTGKPISQIVNSYGAGDSAALSADDRWLAAQTCRTKGFQLWDMRTLEAVARVHPKAKPWRRAAVVILRFTRDGRTLVVANARLGLVAAFRFEF